MMVNITEESICVNIYPVQKLSLDEKERKYVLNNSFIQMLFDLDL